MKTESGYDLIPGRAWGSNTKVSLVISRSDGEFHERVVEEWRPLLRSMSLTKGPWPVPDTAVQIRLTEQNVRALEDEIRALGLA